MNYKLKRWIMGLSLLVLPVALFVGKNTDISKFGTLITIAGIAQFYIAYEIVQEKI